MGYEGASVRLEMFHFLNEVGLPYNNSLSHIFNLDGFLYLCSILNKFFFSLGGVANGSSLLLPKTSTEILQKFPDSIVVAWTWLESCGAESEVREDSFKED